MVNEITDSIFKASFISRDRNECKTTHHPTPSPKENRHTPNDWFPSQLDAIQYTIIDYAKRILYRILQIGKLRKLCKYKYDQKL